MAVARSLAATVTVLGLALALAAPATAAPVMSGHYVVTVNNAITGQTTRE